MGVHYYFSGFDVEAGFPQKLADLLRDDIRNRKSLVFICSKPDGYEKTDKYFAGNCNWFRQAGIVFDEAHMIDYRIPKETAQSLIQNASALFLCGGNTLAQNAFLEEYELKQLIKNSEAVVMGISAGAINMAVKSVCSKDADVERTVIYDGIGLDDISVEPHFRPYDMEFIQDELLPITQTLPLHAVCDNGFVRVNADQARFLGEIYLIKGTNINRIGESL